MAEDTRPRLIPTRGALHGARRCDASGLRFHGVEGDGRGREGGRAQRGRMRTAAGVVAEAALSASAAALEGARRRQSLRGEDK